MTHHFLIECIQALVIGLAAGIIIYIGVQVYEVWRINR